MNALCSHNLANKHLPIHAAVHLLFIYISTWGPIGPSWLRWLVRKDAADHFPRSVSTDRHRLTAALLLHLIVFKYLFLFIAEASGEVRCHGGHHLHGQKQPHLLGADSAFHLRAGTRRLRGAPKCLSLTRGCGRSSVIHTIDERIWTKMGNKQTIFTDEQLDAYQVRFASRARQRIILN